MIDILFISPTCSNNWIVGEGHCHIQLTIYIHSLKFISYKVINSSGMTMLISWKLDPYTVMKLNSGRRGDDVLKRGHLACSSHKPLTSSYSPVTKRLQAGQDHIHVYIEMQITWFLKVLSQILLFQQKRLCNPPWVFFFKKDEFIFN